MLTSTDGLTVKGHAFQAPLSTMEGHMAKSAKLTVVIFLVVLSAGCASMEMENYKAVGFETPFQVMPYEKYAPYYGMRLSSDEWLAFCRRFPDMLVGGTCSSAPIYNPNLNIYAYYWTMQQRKEKWDAATLERLSAKDFRPGDSIYHINWALGPPQRIIEGHSVEVLLYDVIMEQSLLKARKECSRCSWHDPGRDKDDEDRDIIKKLGLERSEH